MKTDIWMPLYIGDYLADTIGLSDQQHGRYLLAIMAYWRKQAPLSDSEAKSILKDDSDTLKRFFQVSNGQWSHKRVSNEIAESTKRGNDFRKRTEAARAALQLKRESVTTPVAMSVTDVQSQSQSQSQSKAQVQVSSPRESRRFAPPTLEEVKLFCAKAGISATDSEWFWNKMEGQGWKNGGKSVVSWQKTLTAWKIAGYLASQKQSNNGHHGSSQQTWAERQANKIITQGIDAL